MKRYKIYIFGISSSEKIKNFDQVNLFLNKLFKLNFNRSDLIIGAGGELLEIWQVLSQAFLNEGLTL